MLNLSRTATRLTLLVILAISSVFVLTASEEDNSTLGKISAESFAGQAAKDVAAFVDVMPGDAFVYAALRTDDGYLDTLDGVIAKFYPLFDSMRALDDTIPPNDQINMRALLNEMLAEGGLSWDADVRPWLGDSIALAGVQTADGSNQPVIFAVDITDREGALNFMRMAAEDQPFSESSDGDFSTLMMEGEEPTLVAVNDSAMYISNSADLIPFAGPPANSLSENGAFNAALDRLPAPGYNIVGYLDVGVATLAVNQTFNDIVGGMGSAVAPAADAVVEGQIVFGATISDGRSMIFDMATANAQAADINLTSIVSTPVDDTFNRYIPADASLVVHGSNLRAAFDEALRIAAAEDPAFNDGLAQVDGLLAAFLQLDFQNDLLGLLEGDYAAFLTFETTPEGDLTLFNTLMGMGGDLGVSGGIIVETTNADNARQLVSGSQNLVMLLGDLGEGVSITTESVAGTDALVVALTDPTLPAPIEIVFAANNDVIVIATRDAAVRVLQGEGGLNNAERYQDAAQFMLENPTTVWYVDRSGVAASQLVVLALLGPAIGNVFEDILEELEEPGVSLPADGATFQLTQGGDDMDAMGQMMMQVLDAFTDAFNSMSITTTVDGNDVLARFVLTLSE